MSVTSSIVTVPDLRRCDIRANPPHGKALPSVKIKSQSASKKEHALHICSLRTAPIPVLNDAVFAGFAGGTFVPASTKRRATANARHSNSSLFPGLWYGQYCAQIIFTARLDFFISPL